MTRPCMLDSSLILTPSGAGQLAFVLASRSHEWHITPIIRGELMRREVRDVIDRAIASGQLVLTEIDTSDEREMDLWAEWSRVVDAGEAEAIAIAIARGWFVALEDRQAQRALSRTRGHTGWINCADLLLNAVNDGVLSLAEADALFRRFDCYGGYAQRGVKSLGELIKRLRER